LRLKPVIIFVGDLAVLLASLLLILLIKQGPDIRIPDNYRQSLLLFGCIWIIVSFITKKYRTPVSEKSFLISAFRILITSGIVLGIITTLMYFFRVDHYSRFVVFGTLLALTVIELIITSVYYAFKNASLGEPVAVSHKYQTVTLRKNRRKAFEKIASMPTVDAKAIKHRRQTVIDSVGKDGLAFIEKYALIDSTSTLLSSTLSANSFHLIPSYNFTTVANLERINDFRYINKFFEAVNQMLPKGGVYIDFFESKNQRKKRILKKFPPVLNYIYYSFDFIIKRIFPKFTLTKQIYFLLTRGNNRVLTKAEAFGRLYSCGFELLEDLETEQYVFFAAEKTKKPLYPEQPSYGPLIKLRRVGKNGKNINVYKLRTMHPYSEFIQDYVYKKEGLKEGGKFKSDFRVSTLGRFFRTIWLDELPMILNLIKRDLKIVGVRPISQHYFNLYPEEHQQRRIKYMPGLVPPFYVDNPKTLEEIIASEKKYFDAWDRNPLRTDLKYFFLAFYNIIFKRARSA
jgi:lipopolysaccharide/colanic/teichoic acid biosynthesis glycosyltransferase